VATERAPWIIFNSSRNNNVRNIMRAPRLAQVDQSHLKHDPPLTAAERRRIALASLAIMERRFQLRIVQIQQERRALLHASP
jgi:hypothetical protein